MLPFEMDCVAKAVATFEDGQRLFARWKGENEFWVFLAEDADDYDYVEICLDQIQSLQEFKASFEGWVSDRLDEFGMFLWETL